jgi:hypothetical protein
MLNAIIFRLVIILLQLVFVFIIASQIMIEELGVYYQNLSIAFLLTSLILSYPDFIFQSLISRRLMNRKTINHFLKPIIFFIILLLIISIISKNVLIGAIALICLLTITNMLRTYLNVLSFKIFTMSTQVLEGILKIIILFIILSLWDDTTSLSIIFAQAVSSISTIYFISIKTLKKNSGQRLTNSLIVRENSGSKIATIVFNTFMNSLYINFLKIYLSLMDALEEVGILGLAQQLIGNLVQSINSILQIQYGNQTLRDKRFFDRAFIPIIAFALVGAVTILGASLVIFPNFENEYQNIPLEYFILVFIFEFYIIPLSFLTKLYIRKGLLNTILKLHLSMVPVIVLSLITLNITGSLQLGMLIGCILTFAFLILYYRRLDHV